MPLESTRTTNKESLIYSKREEDIMREVFSILISKEDVLKELESIIEGKEDIEEFCSALINMSIATGQTFQMIKVLLNDEFIKNNQSKTEGSIMRGNTFASKIVKDYTSPFVHRIVITEHKISLEVDPSKCEGEDELNKHKQLLVDRVSVIVETITNQQNIDRMPSELRILASLFADLAKVHAPKQIWALVGGFLLLRYINPALMTPEAYSLLPEGKIPANVPRRNLILITKMLQNLANGVEFGKKEQFMMVVNDYIKSNVANFEHYFEKVVTFSTKTTAVPDPTAINAQGLHLLHRVVTQNQDKILGLLKDKETTVKVSKLLDSLGSYQSKISFSFLKDADRKSVMSLLEQRRDEAMFIGVVDKTKYGKFQKRILLVGQNRILSIKPGSGKVAREGHLLDIIEIKSPKVNELHLAFHGFNIVCHTEETDNIVNCIVKALYDNFPAMPRQLLPKINVDPASRVITPEEEEFGACGGFVRTYKTLCNFYKIPVNSDVVWHFSNLPSRVKSFDLKRFTKAYSEEEVVSAGLGPLFWSLRFNPYFETLIIKNYKLDKESFLDMVEMLKINKKFKTLVLSGVNKELNLYKELFDSLILNKNSVVTALDISNNNIEDKGISLIFGDNSLKGITLLSGYLSQTPNSIETLDISNTGGGKDGLAVLFNTLKDRAKSKPTLINLSLSDNKLGKSTESLAQLLASSGSNLKTLKMSNIQATYMLPLFESIKRGCPNLASLDVSKNKLTKNDGVGLIGYLESAKSLTELNLSSCKIPVENLRELLTGVCKDTYLKLDLSDNSLALNAAQIVSTVTFDMTNIHTLNLSDNDFGEEGIAVIAEGLCSNTTLKHLILDRNFKGSKSRPQAIENLIKLVKSSNTLEGLSLASGPKSERWKHDIVTFLFAIGENRSLVSLDITGQHMGNKGAITLAKALQRNNTLTAVRWDENMTGLLGFINIKNALLVNQTLKDMPLPISDVGSALKNESDKTKEIQSVLNQIENSLLNNQQHL